MLSQNSRIRQLFHEAACIRLDAAEVSHRQVLRRRVDNHAPPIGISAMLKSGQAVDRERRRVRRVLELWT
jgi:hypothetical protein